MGKKLLNPQDIADAFSVYYSSLYNLHQDSGPPQPTPESIDGFLNSISLPKLSSDYLSTSNQPFTCQEIMKVIQALPHNQSLGPDGFTSEYYQLFHPILSPYLEYVFNAVMSDASFPLLTANIITLPKPGKEPTHVQNFRPVSLLNVNLKLYAKLIANRLLCFLPLLVKYDQVGFVPGHRAPSATRRIINLMHHMENTQRPSLLLTLDAEKASNRVHWGYWSQNLKTFGIRCEIFHAISPLYTVPSAYVYSDGLFSKIFTISNVTSPHSFLISQWSC